MEGCASCFTSPAGQNHALQNIRAEAKKYATTHEKAVAIYKEGFDFKFCEAEVAIAGGIPYFEILSGNS